MSKIYTQADGPPPRRKSKPKARPVLNTPEYLQLTARISSGKMKPFEFAGCYVDSTDAKRMGSKFPARSLTDAVRQFIKSAGLSSDYWVEKYETHEPGVWTVRVVYEPPSSARSTR